MRSLKFIAIAASLTIPAASTLAKPPNIVILFADDLGNGDVSCFGATDLRTPNIDALAAAGVRLTHFYVAAPICAPSRAALLTGRHPIRIGMSTTKNLSSDEGAAGLPSDEITLAELAQTRGYATAIFGKWHLGSAADATPNAQGFDEFFGHHASCIDPFSHEYYASEPWHHDLYRNRDEVFESGEHMTDLITRETLRFIDDHRDRPFLIYVAYNAPHYPMAAQPRFMNALAAVPSPRREHAALVLGIDDSVGRIIAGLRQHGLLDDTFILFTSDNGVPDPSPRGEGGGSNAPYREYKRSLFDGGIHMPAVVSWPAAVPPAGTAPSSPSPWTSSPPPPSS